VSLFFFSWFYFSFIRVRWLCSHNSPSAYPPLLPSDQKSPASSFPGHDNWGGTPPTQPWAHGGNIYDWCVAAPTLFLFLLTATCTMLRQDLIPGLAPTQHNTLVRNNTSLPPHSVLPPPHTHSFQHTIFCKIIDPRLCVRLFVKGARSMGPQTPTRLGKVCKRALVVPPSSSTKEQLSVGRVQAPHRLASDWCPFVIHSPNGLGCFVWMYV